jgi:hypothetical protein
LHADEGSGNSTVLEIVQGMTRVTLRQPPGAEGSAAPQITAPHAMLRAPSGGGGGGGGGSVLQRVVGLIGDVGIIVTSNTTWFGDIGHNQDSLDFFCRGKVSDEFHKPFDGSDAGATVGDLVASINAALGN